MSNMEEGSAAPAEVNVENQMNEQTQSQFDSKVQDDQSVCKDSVSHEKSFEQTKVQEIAASLNSHVEEVPVANPCDPQGSLPLNVDRLVGNEKLLSEIAVLIQEEVNSMNRFQRQIYHWEESIEKNKVLLQEHLDQIKKNLGEINFNKKNRDFWLNRSEQVVMDYTHADALDLVQEWSWLVKKYGLKNSDGSEIDSKASDISDLCSKHIEQLTNIYIAAGMKFDALRKDREQINLRFVTENGKLLKQIAQLQSYIQHLCKTEIEPLQDGVLLLKELNLKVRVFLEKPDASYGDLRMWAESFLDEFLKMNPNTPMRIVTEFRRLAQISLPAQNS